MWLRDPVVALSRIRVFRDLKLESGVLSGYLTAPFALIGEVRFPFSSRFDAVADTAELLPIEPAANAERDTVAFLGGKARLQGDRVCYQAELTLELNLPEGQKWGGRAFRKMAEAAFERTLSHTLRELNSLS